MELNYDSKSILYVRNMDAFTFTSILSQKQEVLIGNWIQEWNERKWDYLDQQNG